MKVSKSTPNASKSGAVGHIADNVSRPKVVDGLVNQDR